MMKWFTNVGTKREPGISIVEKYKRRGYVIGKPQGTPTYSAERMEAAGDVGVYEPTNITYAENIVPGTVLYKESHGQSNERVVQSIVGDSVVLLIIKNIRNGGLSNKLFKRNEPIMYVDADVVD
jgi:hypothetical protein